MVYHKDAFWRIKKTCQYCGKEFEVYPSRKNAIYCSQQCHYQDCKPIKRSLIPNVTRENLNKSYWKEKLSLRETAEKLGVGWRTVFRWMKRYNITRRSRKEGAKIAILRHLSKAPKREKIVELYKKQGYTTREIAEKMGVCKSTVLNWLKRFGIPTMTYEEVQQRRSNASLRMWQKNKEEIVKKLVEGTHKRPTGPERKLQKIIGEHNLPFRYTGNGAVIINGRCPDFTRNDGRKQIIEVFGSYWHSPLYEPTLKNPRRSEKAVLEDYKSAKYDCLIIWESEMHNEDALIEKIQSFVGD